MYRTKTVKSPIHGNGCRLEGKNPKLDGTASIKPRKFIELPEIEEDVHPENDSGWCIDHGVPLPERDEK